MLSIFRQRGLSNIVYGVVILATVLVFVIQFRPDANKKAASCTKPCALMVRGYCVEQKAFNATVLLLMPRGAEVSSAKMAQIKEIAKNGLTERELLISEAERLGLAVSESEVTDSIFSGWVRISIPDDNPSLAMQLTGGHDPLIPIGFKDPKTKSFDMKVYERTVRNISHLSPADFREEQKREILAAKMRDVIRASIRVSEAEAYAGYVAQYNTATINYVNVKQSYAAKYGVTVTDADVAAYTKDHQADVDKVFEERKAEELPKEGRVRHILAQFNDSHGQRPPTAEERAAALAKISMAYARVKGGESFAEVARDVSDDPGSAKKGGGYDKEMIDGMVEPWKNAANALKPGEMTQGAIETEYGYHILFKDDPSKTDDATAAVKKGIARELVTKDRAGQLARDVAGFIVADMKAGKSAEDAVAAHMAAFSKPQPAIVPIKVLNADEAAKAAAAKAAAAAVDGGAPAAPVAGDAGAAASDASAGAAPEKKDEKKADKADPLAAYKPLTAATDPDRPRVQTSAPFNQNADPPAGFDPSAAPELMSFAFGAKDGDVLATPLAATDGFMAVQLKEHHATSPEHFSKGKDIYLAELLAKKQAEALALYVKQLRQTADKAGEVKFDAVMTGEKAADGGAPAPAEPLDDEGY